jgi:hypothetical protein
VGEIILRDVALRYGPEAVRCVAVVHPGYAWAPDPALDRLEVHLVRSDHTNTLGVRGFASGLRSMLRFATGFEADVQRIVRPVGELARDIGCERLLVVLNHPLMFALAHRLERNLSLPLTTLVWDPPGYQLEQARFDRLSRARLRRHFERSLKSSRHVAVVSDAMRSDYARHTQAPIDILRHGVSTRDIDALARSSASQDGWVIGFAGSMYAKSSWRAFIRALDSVRWEVAGRRVRLRMLTSNMTVATKSAAAIEYLGFRGSEEVRELLANCHVNYLPLPFESRRREFSCYSFPTKLTTYLAAGRPVFAHCPSDSALSRFLAEHPCGTTCDSLEPATIIAALEGVLGSAPAHDRACAQAVAVAREHFDVAVFHRSIDRVLGLDSVTDPVQVVPSDAD